MIKIARAMNMETMTMKIITVIMMVIRQLMFRMLYANR